MQIFFRNDEFYDYSDISNPKYFYGHALNIGDYPNQIKAFHKYLHPLRRILTFKPRFRESADLKLRSAKAAKEIDLKRYFIFVCAVGVLNVLICALSRLFFNVLYPPTPLY